ncbi:MAG: hypothetical protein HFJ28_04935 [Clostridia bacterium]|jgi:cell division protein FtsL|nr:hypothetical protein [Clostridia bacterium]
MNNEQKQSDWKELERWNAQKEAKMQETYGADITKLKEEKSTKKIDKISKVLEKIVKAILILHVIVIIGIIVATAIYLMSVRKEQQSRPIFGGAFEE